MTSWRTLITGRSILNDFVTLKDVEMLFLEMACCNENALKACSIKRVMEFLLQLLVEAFVLQIEKGDLLLSFSKELVGAKQKKGKAKDIYAYKAQMSELKAPIWTSEDIIVIMPHVDDVKAGIFMAKSWLNNIEPILEFDFSRTSTFCYLMKLEKLKELVSQLRVLKITLEQQSVLEKVLKKFMEWQYDAYSLLQYVECLYDVIDIGDGRSNGLVSKIEHLVNLLEAITKVVFLSG